MDDKNGITLAGTPSPSKGGRPQVYETKIEPRLNEIGEMFSRGLTRSAVADVLGVSVETFRKYERTQEALAAKIALSKSHGAAMMVNALFELATGKATAKTVKTKTYDDGRTVVEEIVETLPPNLAAIEKLLARLDSFDADSPQAVDNEARRKREEARVAAMNEADYSAFNEQQSRRALMFYP